MRSNLFKIAQAASLWLAIIFTISCDAAGNPSALVGRWIGVSGGDKGAVMDLLSDGTGIFTEEDSKGLAITWKTENGRFYLTFPDEAFAADYKLQGSLLTFTEDSGETIYTKCHKDCRETAKEYIKAKFTGVKKGSFTDSRDGRSYKTLKFGNQTWMAENLGYNADGSKCYENNESNCQKYGRLYNWNTALNACPKGWHLPSGEEWKILIDLVGGDKVAGNILKAASGWDGVDAIGFSALPGHRGWSDGDFSDPGHGGYWWSASEGNSDVAYNYRMAYGIEYAFLEHNVKGSLLSVRCLQD